VGNPNEKLIKGTTIYMIGNLTSKLMQLLFLPIITGLLLTDEYGYYDLVISTASLIIPIFTLQLTESLFKFIFKSSNKEKIAIISTVTVFITFGILVLGIVLVVLYRVSDFIEHPLLIFLHYATFAIYTLYQKISRSHQKNKVFAISGVIHTFVIILTQVFLLIVFKMRVEALLIANIVSNLACIIYMENAVKARKMFSIKAISVITLKSLLKFSIPLVPNSISWWFVKSINTYFVVFFLGVGANGVYSIANKFPQLITFVTSVFQMAWQESAILESDSMDRIRFYSNVFNAYAKLLITSCIVALPLIKIFMPHLVDEKYIGGTLIIPFLLVGVIFSSLSQFYGVGYLAFNKTKGALSTTVVAAIINSIISVCLIPHWGLFAPAIGTMCAYLMQWIYRIYQMRDYFKLHVEWKNFLLYGCILIAYIIVFYVVEYNVIQVGLLIMALIGFSIGNRILLGRIINRIISKKNRS
jgi:O-antigen/teichoic acid export membrane protein